MLLTDDRILTRAIRDPVDLEQDSPILKYKSKVYDIVLLGAKLLPSVSSDDLIAELSEPFSFSRGGIVYQTHVPQIEIIQRWQDSSLSYGKDHLGWCGLFRITLHEGKHHQIRRIAKRIRLHVLSLHRSRLGHILTSDSVPLGGCRTITDEEIQELYIGLGLPLLGNKNNCDRTELT